MENANPGGNQIPVHRFQEIQEQLRKMDQQNRELRQTIDGMVARQNAPPPAPEEKPLFQPEVEQALDKKIKGMLEPETAKLKHQVGYLVDRNDELEFIQKWGVEKHKAYNEKIEGLRQQAMSRGQFLRREDAYKHIFFEENGTKPAPKPEAPKGPTFDPYTQSYVEPKVEAPVQQPAPQQAAPAPQQMAPKETEIELPPVGPINTPTPPSAPRTTGIELTTDEKALDSWANKYGDVPL